MLERIDTYNLRKLPNWVQYDQTQDVQFAPRWSGKIPPPAIGTRVRVSHFGFATVRNYFVESGFLGVGVALEDPPKWWRKQNRKRLALVFGNEINLTGEYAHAIVRS